MLRTKKGKEKKLNYTSIDGMRPTGCSFQMNLRNPNSGSSLYVRNVRNSIRLPIVFPDDLDTLAQFLEWLTGFMAACPADYFDKVNRMKHMSHRTIKYFNGDIFRFEIDLEHYGFGLIMGQPRKMQKDGLLRKEHILNDIMGIPLLIRLCWGPGIIVRHGARDFPESLNRLMRHSCSFGVGSIDLEYALERVKSEAGLHELEQCAFQYFDVPLDITFDEFNRQHDGMTRAEYAEYANKTGGCTRKK